MTDRVTVVPIDSVYDSIRCEPALALELREYFTFDVPGARHSPKFKQGVWDGKIRLFKKGMLYSGLREQLRQFCLDREYAIECPLEQRVEPDAETLSDFIQELGLPEDRLPRGYQQTAVAQCIRHERVLLLSPTASGKSLIIYMLARWFDARKTLVIVPTAGLILQMRDDFVSYGCSPEMISLRGDDPGRAITVTTWQWAVNREPEWFEQFGVVFGDEAHLFAAKSLVAIMESLRRCPVRIGTTGTLDGSKTNQLVLEGLFGPVFRVTTTKELQDQGHVAKLKIKVIVLRHPERVRRGYVRNHGKEYKDELDYLVGLQARNDFLAGLSTSLEGNTMLLYRFVEKHGIPLYEAVRELCGTRKSFHVHGGVSGEDRTEIKALLEKEDDAVFVASTGTFSTGENVRRLHNIVFGAPYKSQVTVPQSIGRGLRLGEGKDGCTLYDVADDLGWGNRKNHTLRHMEERVAIYAKEQFEYEIYKIDLEY